MPRSFAHLTPRYVVNRVYDKFYRATHPGLPWLAPGAIDFLADFLQPTDTGLEFGSGRSTIWFAHQVAHLTSVEHNQAWYENVKKNLAAAGLNNIQQIFAPKTQQDGQEGESSNYVRVCDSIPPNSLDFALIDGIYRAQCAWRTLPLLKPHGILIIDNVNHALPSNSIAPNSRSLAAGPKNEIWLAVWEQIHSWRRYWSMNGVSDTAIFFKP